MADKNVPALAPKRSNEKILPFTAWVPIGKSNYVLDLQKKQKNQIFQIFVDILQNINFFRAFTASALLDETRFVSDANLLREALEITPINQAHQFVSPPSGDAIMDFVNELGYTEGIITSTNVDYVELMWEKFVQAIQTFLTDNANLGSPTKKCRKEKPHVIPYCRLTKLSICHLGRIHNIHQRSASLFYLAEKEPKLGNLKFVSKGEVDEVFGMLITNELISNNIRNAPYYNAYLEMVAKHDQKVAAKKEGKKKIASAKQAKPKPAKKNPSKPSTAKPTKPKPTKEKSTKATPLQKDGKGKVAKFCNVKSSFQLVNELDEEPAQLEPEPEHPGEGEEYDVERAIQMSLQSFHTEGHAHVRGVAIQEPVAESTRPLPVVEGKGKAIVTEEQAAQSLLALYTPKRRSTTDQFIFQRRTPATKEASTRPSAQPQDDTSANIIRESLSLLQMLKQVLILTRQTVEAGSDPSKTPESRPLPEQVFMNEDQAGPDPGFPVDEHVILEEPLSSSGTLSSMKNLDDAYIIGDQFINDKSTKDEPGKLNMESKVVSMVTVPIHQASSLVPLLSTLVIDLSSPSKPNHFRELLKADMKESLHQRMFETGTYKSLPEHVALYEALEASME
ncbi:hypothetical protein Tco_0921073 [Tanacetum coccineum]